MRLFKIVLGTMLICIAYGMITVPMEIVNGGVTSFSLICEELSHVHIIVFVGIYTFLILSLCLFFLGRSYFVGSVFAAVCHVLFFAFFHQLGQKTGFYWHGSLVVAVLLASTLVGLGYALCLSAQATVVGFDTLALIIHKHVDWLRLDWTMAIINCMVLLLGLLVFSWQVVVAGVVFSVLQANIMGFSLPYLEGTGHRGQEK